MTVESLAFISEQLLNAGIKYEFGEWSNAELPSPYSIGEFIDIVNDNEDGLIESQFIITTTSMNSWLECMEVQEKIEQIFPSVGGCVATLNNGSSVAVFFENSHNVPTDTMNLKRLQINLMVKEWKVK